MRLTLAQYLEHEAKMKPKQKAIPDAVEREADLHQQITEYCRSKGWILFHGSMVHRAMRTIGEPDCTILADRGRVFFIEAKSRTGKLSREQAGLIAWAEKLDHRIYLVRSMAGFRKVVEG